MCKLVLDIQIRERDKIKHRFSQLKNFKGQDTHSNKFQGQVSAISHLWCTASGIDMLLGQDTNQVHKGSLLWWFELMC